MADDRNAKQDTAQAQELIERDELAEYNFSAFSSADSTNPPATTQDDIHNPPPIPNAFSAAETWTRVGEIIDAAALCEGDLCSESAWNGEVHCRLLGVALKGWRASRGVGYMDVYAITFSPRPFLCPAPLPLTRPLSNPASHRNKTLTVISRSTTARIDTAAAPASGLSKMVDYALVLIPSYTLHKSITTLLRAKSLASINATKAEYVRFKPITVSIETKRPGMDEDGAKVQLGVWAGAHFERLRLLLSSPGLDGEGDGGGENGVPLPFLPEAVVQGHDWRLKIAEVLGDGNVVRLVLFSYPLPSIPSPPLPLLTILCFALARLN